MAISLLDTKEYKASQVALSKIIQKEQSGIIGIYSKALKDSQAKIKALYDKYAKDGKLSNADQSIIARMKALENECVSILKDADINVEKTIKEQTQNIYNESFYRHVWSIDSNIKASINWGLIPEEAVKAAFNSDYKFLATSKTFSMAQNKNIAKVRDAISLSLVRGDSYQTLSKHLTAILGVTDIAPEAKRYIGKGASAWAMTVSRTEGQRAIVEGQSKAYKTAKDAGCDISLFWDATLDGRTRPSHGALDGTAKDEEHDGWFVPELNRYVSAPLHSGVAWFDVNCRCRVTPRLNYLGDDAKPTERRIRGEGVQKYKTYNEWKKELNYENKYEGDNKRGISGNKKKMEKDLDYYGKQGNAFNDAPIELQTLVQKVNEKGEFILIEAGNGSNFYNPKLNSINIMTSTMNDKLLAGHVRHEMGHKMDWFLGNGNYPISSSPKFIRAMQLDKEDLFNKIVNNFQFKISHPDIDEIAYIVSNGRIGKIGPLRKIYYEKTGNQNTDIFAFIIDKIGNSDKTLFEEIKQFIPRFVKQVEREIVQWK